MKYRPVIPLFLSLGLQAQPACAEPVKAIHEALTLAATPAEVWARWTTEEGIRSFFAPAGRVEATPGGAYEIYFFPDQPPGRRGAEGTVVLAVEPQRRFAVTWDAPPAWPFIRRQRTFLELRFEPLDDGGTRLSLTHMGWGDGDEWVEVFEYFEGAWSVVLRRLEYSFEHGPIDWSAVPDGLRYEG